MNNETLKTIVNFEIGEYFYFIKCGFSQLLESVNRMTGATLELVKIVAVTINPDETCVTLQYIKDSDTITVAPPSAYLFKTKEEAKKRMCELIDQLDDAIEN